MHNALFVAALAGILVSLIGLRILAERAHRRRIRPGFCHTCIENPVGPGETECEDCWMGRQW